jgi:beta-glucosidase
MKTRIRSTVIFLFLFISVCFSQAPKPTSPEIEAKIDSMLKQLSLEEKVDLIGGVDDFFIRDIKHIGLPRLKMADGPLGVRNYGPSTTFGGIALAATWNVDLARQVGTTIGQDARARGVHFMLGPGVNIYRAPMCGRNFEYFGEDPFLASRIAVGYIEGMQSEGVSATIKHFMGNSSEFKRHDSDSIIDERTMHEIYLPTFEAAVKEAHVGAIMDSYNLTNGVHMTQNGALNTDVVKKDWGFDGIIMSDWDATYDGVAAANGGLDLEMPSGRFMNRATLLPAIKAGKVSVATIDDKVRRILRTAIQFGWLDRDQTDLSISRFNSEGNLVALEGARESMVLLKNDGNVLPFDKSKIKSVAVIGPDAYPGQPTGGGSAGVKPFFAIGYLEGLTRYLGKDVKVYYERGVPELGDLAQATNFTVDSKGTKPGLTAEFFKNVTLSGKPSSTSTTDHLNFDRVPGGYEEMSARWTGYFTPKTPGDHVIFLAGAGEEGGYRLFVDDKQVIDNWDLKKALISELRVPLQAGPHKIRVEYFVHAQWGEPRLQLGILRPEAMVNPAAKEVASKADAVVLAAGFDPGSESEGSDRTFQLPPGQDELITQVAAANKNTVVVITSGGGVDMNAWLDHVPALFQSWYGGQEAGPALAQLLFGEFSPSGKLPVTFDRRGDDSAVYKSYYPQTDLKVTYSEGVFLGYRHYDKTGSKPLFPFGYGQSYTSFGYKNLMIAPSTVNGNEPVTISFDVTNTGNRPGTEVAEVYVGEPQTKVPRPVRELKGFSKVALMPGETRHLEVTLDQRAFSYYDATAHRWTADAGQFDVSVGRSDAQIELTGKVTRQ